MVFTGQNTQPTVSKYWRRKLQRKKKTTQRTKYTRKYEIAHAKKIRIYNTASPLVYNNMGWIGDGSHRGQVCKAWTAVSLPPRYPQISHKIHLCKSKRNPVVKLWNWMTPIISQSLLHQSYNATSSRELTTTIRKLQENFSTKTKPVLSLPSWGRGWTAWLPWYWLRQRICTHPSSLSPASTATTLVNVRTHRQYVCRSKNLNPILLDNQLSNSSYNQEYRHVLLSHQIQWNMPVVHCVRIKTRPLERYQQESCAIAKMTARMTARCALYK